MPTRTLTKFNVNLTSATLYSSDTDKQSIPTLIARQEVRDVTVIGINAIVITAVAYTLIAYNSNH